MSLLLETFRYRSLIDVANFVKFGKKIHCDNTPDDSTVMKKTFASPSLESTILLAELSTLFALCSGPVKFFMHLFATLCCSEFFFCKLDKVDNTVVLIILTKKLQ